ncbi:hypothetical protein [Nocardioides deserti]|uniref:WD40 repeat domain-containing protein n=1 Tax=Nocardioides deserti TaxID=1588644 RepID=A0ABR6U4Z6_9ACTN|nr:hypothetical protein [Nocardioides deserti]MBC2959507.1 hypothetical protein [Nocardioides deserti]GGO73732.1 hypothetical protein GCM10012276_20060 [Nocardioides deserti]
MTHNLRDLLERESGHLEASLDPTDAWTEGVRRRRRRTAVGVASAAAALALVGVVTWAVLPGDSSPSPALSPTPSVPTSPEVVEGSGTSVERDQVLPSYDPAEWESLPEYPGDLGWWASADSLVPLGEDPVSRATAAVQIMLGPEVANVWVYGDDGGWRSLDTTGLDLVDTGEYELGLGRGSLSPDGTRLAIGQAEGVVVIDLTTAESRMYPVEGLGEVWTGRSTYWTPDGAAVLLGRSWAALGEPLEYTNGWRIDVGDGSVSRLGFDPTYAALLEDGRVVADHWSETSGHLWSRFDPAGAATPLGDLDAYAVLDQPAARGQRWAALRQLTTMTPERSWDRDGFVVLDDEGRPLSLLPVKGTEKNGGGGRVIGWATDSVMLFSMPEASGSPAAAGVVAWDVETGELWRGPLMLVNSFVSVAQQW